MSEPTEEKAATPDESRAADDESIKTICYVRKTARGYNIWLPDEAFK
jgi:hypothetical protein